MVAISDIQLHLPRVADKFEYDVIVLSYSNLVFPGLFSFNHVYFKTKPSKVNYFFKMTFLLVLILCKTGKYCTEKRHATAPAAVYLANTQTHIFPSPRRRFNLS